VTLIPFPFPSPTHHCRHSPIWALLTRFRIVRCYCSQDLDLAHDLITTRIREATERRASKESEGGDSQSGATTLASKCSSEHLLMAHDTSYHLSDGIILRLSNQFLFVFFVVVTTYNQTEGHLEAALAKEKALMDKSEISSATRPISAPPIPPHPEETSTKAHRGKADVVPGKFNQTGNGKRFINRVPKGT